MGYQYNWGAFSPTHEDAIPEAGRWRLSVTQAVIEGFPLNVNFGCLWCQGEARRQSFSSTAPRSGEPVPIGVALGDEFATEAGKGIRSQFPPYPPRSHHRLAFFKSSYVLRARIMARCHAI